MREDVESGRIFAAGLVIRDLPALESNWRATGTLGDYLRDNNVVGIADIDTRKLTRILREKGAQNGCIVAGPNLGAAEAGAAIAKAKAAPSMAGLDLAQGGVVRAALRLERRRLVTGRAGTPRHPRPSSTSSPTISASSTTSCACSPIAAAG